MIEVNSNTKKEITVMFHSAFSENIKNFFLTILQKEYIVKISEEYEYYFAQESIYWSKENMRELLESREEAIRIMFCGEAVYPDLNLFDFAVVLQNNQLVVEDRILYLPFIEFNDKMFFSVLNVFDVNRPLEEYKEIIKKKEKFCNFIYSNSRAHCMRDKIFYELSQYRKVDSLGQHLKNVEIEDTREKEDWDLISIEMKRPYKFSITAENAKFNGYTSEKIITSMLADTIPIYWGNPIIYEEYNEEAFINVNRYKDLAKLVRDIKEIDKDDSRYLEILKQPRRTQIQIRRCEERITSFYKNFYALFKSDKYEMQRRPQGTWPNEIYPQFLIKENYWNVPKILKSIQNRILNR